MAAGAHGEGALARCDPATLASLSEAERAACVQALKAVADRDDGRYDDHREHVWRRHGLLSPCTDKALSKRLSLNFCGGVTLKYRF